MKLILFQRTGNRTRLRFVQGMFTLRVPGLTLGPRIRKYPDELVLSSPWIVRVLSLWSHQNLVRVDRRLGAVFFQQTTLWFLHARRTVRFRDVDHVEYSFEEAATSWDFRGRSHDTVEFFTVSLVLQGERRAVPVARFIGEGAAGDFATWILGDDLVDYTGNQADDSRHFVQELCDFLGVPLGPAPLPPKADAEGKRWKCSACGRAVAPQPKCLYCGGEAGPE